MNKIKAMAVSLAFFAVMACGEESFKTVKIGEQTWMAENLNIDLPGSKCYNNDPANCKKYGRLYDWETAIKACPSGWHLPSNDEWQILVDFAGGTKIAGEKLKIKSGWNKRKDGNSGNGTDNHGFSALPGGYGISDGSFYGVGNNSTWWSASENGSDAYVRCMDYNREGVRYYGSDERDLFSVRCVSDLNETKAVPSKAQAISTEPLESSRDNNTTQIGTNTQKTVKIGTQTWMAENSNKKTAPPGSNKCYNNNESNCQKYGRLYTWSGAKFACPEGWHLPSDNEWQTLIDFAGGDKIAGKILKASSGWDGSGNGTNNFGFTALPGGIGLSNGDFRDVGNGGLWWSSTEDDTKKAYRRSMDINSTDVHRSSSDKNLLFSVRCVENNEGNTIRGDAADGNNGQAIAELEQEAKKWKNSSADYKTRESQFFSFKGIVKMSPGDYSEDYFNWTATSKIKIGDCPAKSVWKMTSQCGGAGCNGKNKIPPKCQSITPKVITDFNFDYDAM